MPSSTKREKLNYNGFFERNGIKYENYIAAKNSIIRRRLQELNRLLRKNGHTYLQYVPKNQRLITLRAKTKMTQPKPLIQEVYTVSWSMDVAATSHLDAARQVHKLLNSKPEDILNLLIVDLSYHPNAPDRKIIDLSADELYESNNPQENSDDQA